MDWVWENGEWAIEIQAWYDYPDSGFGENYVELWIEQEEGRIVLTNLFRVWATRPHEIKEYNEVLWQAVALQAYPLIFPEYPHLSGRKCKDLILVIYRAGGEFERWWIDDPDKLRQFEFQIKED